MSAFECPNCKRPVNEGNSPNKHECHETDDEDGLCEAYALIHAQREYIKYLTHASDMTGTFLHVHNWKWPEAFLKEGEQLRAEIKRLEN